MRNLRWQLLIAVGGFILVVGLLIGQTSDPTVAPPEPVAGGVYQEALIGSIIRLNPLLDSYNQVDRDINRLLYNGLVRFDLRGIPEPDLAESWAISADATLYTLTLREDAFWHDGEPVTSDDIIYTFSKFQDGDYPGPTDLKALWDDVNIIRLDERRVQFQLPEPFAPFLDYLTVGLVPDHLLRGVSAGELIAHPFNLDPIGTGPFAFDRFLTQDGAIQGVSLVANDAYFSQRPFLERVEFRLFSNSTAALEAYLGGEVQGIGRIDADTLTQVLESPQLNLHTARLPEFGLVFINLKHPEKTFLADKSFRQAMLLAVNRQWIINQSLGGQGLIPSGPILPFTWAYADGLEPFHFDPERAGTILDSMGWKLPTGAIPNTPEYQRGQDEVQLSIELTHPEDPFYRETANNLKASWEAIGIKTELNPVSSEELLEAYLEPRTFEAVLTDLNTSRFPDPDPYPFWHDSQTETGQNYSGFEDRNISIWLEQARITPDRSRRAELYRNFQYRFQDQIPALLIYYHVFNYAIDGQVQGVSIGPLIDPSDRFNKITDWHLLARRGLPSGSTPESTP